MMSDGLLYFRTTDANGNARLWKSDGTEAGTQVVAGLERNARRRIEPRSSSFGRVGPDCSCRAATAAHQRHRRRHVRRGEPRPLGVSAWRSRRAGGSITRSRTTSTGLPGRSCGAQRHRRQHPANQRDADAGPELPAARNVDARLRRQAVLRRHRGGNNELMRLAPTQTTPDAIDVDPARARRPRPFSEPRATGCTFSPIPTAMAASRCGAPTARRAGRSRFSTAATTRIPAGSTSGTPPLWARRWWPRWGRRCG